MYGIFAMTFYNDNLDECKITENEIELDVNNSVKISLFLSKECIPIFKVG